MNKKGFTLVELMVVVGILSIIMLTISQPVANVIKYQRESQITDNMRDNLQFIINKMEKELKTASIVSVLDSSNLKFIDQYGNIIYYKYSDKNIIRNDVNLTNNLFSVADVKFIKNNSLVTVYIKANSLDNKDNVSMQTSVLPVNNLTFHSTTNNIAWKVAFNMSKTDRSPKDYKDYKDYKDSEFLGSSSVNFYPSVIVNDGGGKTAQGGWIANNDKGTNGNINDWTQFIFRQNLYLPTKLSDEAKDKIDKIYLRIKWAADDSGNIPGSGSWTPKYRVNNGELKEGVWKTSSSTYVLGEEIDITGFKEGINTIDFYVQGNGVSDGLKVESLGLGLK